ncbi:SCO family protein [Thalassobaculum sp.]|uniref:SCO family protein n=1 Tax=Thalassobaculum sp. TaxID=2022740 RepID=UPI0032ECF553
MSTRTFVLVVTLLSAALAATVVGGYLIWTRTQEGTAALIGGPFELVDQSGRTVTDQTLIGKWSLIYFGYTFCPDVCPTSLTVMTQALDQVGPAADKVTPVFITVDPERDTVEQLAGYHDHFHPGFVMLTGTPAQVKTVAKAYRVYYRKAETEASTDYLMDHSSITYLMDPDGNYVTHFAHDATPEGMARTIREKVGG